jgi:hypothetical protein
MKEKASMLQTRGSGGGPSPASSPASAPAAAPSPASDLPPIDDRTLSP